MFASTNAASKATADASDEETEAILSELAAPEDVDGDSDSCSSSSGYDSEDSDGDVLPRAPKRRRLATTQEQEASKQEEMERALEEAQLLAKNTVPRKTILSTYGSSRRWGVGWVS